MVLDTNVLLSGCFFDGNERDLLVKGLAGRYRLVLSDDILCETRRVVAEKFHDSPDRILAARFIDSILASSEVWHGRPSIRAIAVSRSIIDDAGDIPIVAFVMDSEPDAFVSGDKALLTLKRIGGTKVVRTRLALEMLG